MASQFRPRSFAAKAALKTAKRPARPLTPAPLPGAVVDALLRYHDEEQDQGGGRTLLRFSARRLRDAEVKAALGDHAARAAGVAILWNAREEEIIRVFEAADARLAA
ncbi:MAG: hypothetical protein JWQ46_1002 [Phenylobacterium sp.]|jgi:hypothetical protein|nr:hypothetical protein [Phenylobacterium sp.]MDB5466240.1 hypothetical protein [Phenylobacterium sp.]